jgi:hypothetical protein
MFPTHHLQVPFCWSAREGNGMYYWYLFGLNPASWLYEAAKNDVYMLRECRMDAMFCTMSKLVLKGWHEAKEGALADTFLDSYLKKYQFYKWYYCVLGFLAVFHRITVMNEVQPRHQGMFQIPWYHPHQNRNLI